MLRFNYKVAAERAKALVHYQAEINRVEAGTWTPDPEAKYRWRTPEPSLQFMEEGGEQEWFDGDEAIWAARECKVEIAYIKNLEKRLEEGDPFLWDYENWVEHLLLGAP